jgi:phosphoribosyl 1,2-cyclic phosphodiesterase
MPIAGHFPPAEPAAAEGLALCVLASGSRGNAIYVASGRSSVLLDAGLSAAEIERRLRSRSLAPENLSAIIVSHEHSDHTQGVGTLSRRYRLPVYATRGTWSAGAQGLRRAFDSREFTCGCGFTLGDLSIHPFALSHDAADPAGFTLRRGALQVGVATDLGAVTHLVKSHLQACTAVVIESNHDPDMLAQGPYPWFLKQRIAGRTGHLSNPDAGALLQEIDHPGLRHVILGHLSATNNTPEKARAAAAQVFSRRKMHLDVALQDRCGPLVHFF